MGQPQTTTTTYAYVTEAGVLTTHATEAAAEAAYYAYVTPTPSTGDTTNIANLTATLNIIGKTGDLNELNTYRIAATVTVAQNQYPTVRLVSSYPTAGSYFPNQDGGYNIATQQIPSATGTIAQSYSPQTVTIVAQNRTQSGGEWTQNGGAWSQTPITYSWAGSRTVTVTIPAKVATLPEVTAKIIEDLKPYTADSQALYTTAWSTWNTFLSKYETNETTTSNNKTQQEVNEAVATINAVDDLLVLKADGTALSTAIASAETLTGEAVDGVYANAHLFEADTFGALVGALEAGKAYYAPFLVEGADVDNFAADGWGDLGTKAGAIVAAIESLTTANGLEDLISQAVALLLNTKTYTATTFTALEEALTAAKLVGEDTTLLAKAQTIDALNTAITGLENRANGSALDQAVSDANIWLGVYADYSVDTTALSIAIADGKNKLEAIAQGLVGANEQDQGLVNNLVTAIATAKGNVAGDTTKISANTNYNISNVSLYTKDSFENLVAKQGIALTAITTATPEAVKSAIDGLNGVTLVFRANGDDLADELEAGDSLTEEGYINSTWSDFADKKGIAQGVLDDVNAGLIDIDHQEDVNTATTNLYSARIALRAVLTPITEAETDVLTGKSKSAYTSSSWSAFLAEIAAAKDTVVVATITPAQVTAVASRISEAVELLKIVVDLTGLDAAIKSVTFGEVNPGYTASTWSDLQTELANGISLYDTLKTGDVAYEDEQETVNTAKTAITGALQALVVDVDELEGLLTQAKALLELNYTTSSLATLNGLVAAAQGVYNNPNKTIATVAGQVAILTNALPNGSAAVLVPGVDDIALKGIIDKSTSGENAYTRGSWGEYQNALKAAQDVVADNEKTADDGVEAGKVLTAAIVALNPKVNLSALTDAIGRYGSEITEDVYNKLTTISQGLLDEAIATARGIVAEADAKSGDWGVNDEPDNHASTISGAAGALTTAIEEKIEKADGSTLFNEITKIGTPAEADFTTSSYTAFNNVLGAANEVLKKIENQEYNAENIGDILTNAISNLQGAFEALDPRVDVSDLEDLLDKLEEEYEGKLTKTSNEEFGLLVKAAEDVLNAYDELTGIDDKGNAYYNYGVSVDTLTTVVNEDRLTQTSSKFAAALAGLEGFEPVYKATVTEYYTTEWNKANSLTEGKYTTETYNAVKKALADNSLDLEDSTNEQVEAAYNALKKANDALVKKASLIVINMLKDNFDDLNAETYTPNSYNELKKLVDEAKELLANNEALIDDGNYSDQDAVDAISQKILTFTGEGKLITRADKTTLGNNISDAREYVKNATTYTLASLQELSQKIETAQDVYEDHNATADQVGVAISDLLSGIANLVKYLTAEDFTVDAVAETYNGSDKHVVPTSVRENVSIKEIIYNTEDGKAPINAGTYTVTIIPEVIEGAKFAYAGKPFVYTDVLVIGKATITEVTAVYDNATYDGATHEVTVTADEKYTGNITVVYVPTASVNSKPTNAGEYTVKVIIVGDSNYEASTIALDEKLTIAKAVITIADLVYDLTAVKETGSALPVNVTTNLIGIGDIAVLYNNDSAEPTAAGVYTVSVTIAESTNYNAITEPLVLGEYTITAKEADLKGLNIVQSEGGFITGAPWFGVSAGQWIYLTAFPNYGFVFDGWKVTGLEGKEVIFGNTLSFFMPGDGNFTGFGFWQVQGVKGVKIEAIYRPLVTSTINITNDAAQGTVFGLPFGNRITEGTPINLTATPKFGYVFDGWTVDGVTATTGWGGSLSFIMPANDVNVTANYTALVYRTVRSVANNGYIAGLPFGGSVLNNTDLYLTPVANFGFQFKEWKITKAGGVVETITTNALSLKVTADVTIEAVFEKPAPVIPTFPTFGPTYPGFGTPAPAPSFPGFGWGW
ncbi:hypothetical protein FACS1894219_08590 [Clostridia bacterium]|nr:hypothetical protein FACS1894219_08590 [Clostridia bacterium]